MLPTSINGFAMPSFACESISHTQIFQTTRRPTSPHNFFPQHEKRAAKTTSEDEEKYIKIYYRHSTKGEQNIKVNGRKFIT